MKVKKLVITASEEFINTLKDFLGDVVGTRGCSATQQETIEFVTSAINRAGDLVSYDMYADEIGVMWEDEDGFDDRGYNPLD